ncbi:Epidermal patterning factor-like protein [Heracleum sosnowskyi]|uniref:Epidermal patterning factor-like protein n=1 Tax=Heracleum sosnowskyi TaxID=360622 RepID=A0AAD8N1N8_9APIA|nr:Epidermal patterning factor-like protein [Heracleum sosnowskyi]
MFHNSNTSMKGSIRAAIFLSFLLLLSDIVLSRHISRSHSHHGHHHPTRHSPNGLISRPLVKHKKADTLQVAGSRLPDCSHACGSCSPCRLVMVSFVCATIQEAESCPMAYKCMCNNKSYPVP